MRDFFIGLLVGVILSAVTGWYFVIGRNNETIQQAQDAVASGIENAAGSLAAKLDAFELSGKDIKADMGSTGRVVRRSARAVGAAVAGATSDPRITTLVKGKLAMDRELSAWNISVNTTDGVVTLAGSVAHEQQIGKAVLIALETTGVKEVVSTLRVKGA